MKKFILLALLISILALNSSEAHMTLMTATGSGAVGGGSSPLISDNFSSDATEANYTAIEGSGINITGGVAEQGTNIWDDWGWDYHETATGSNDHYVQVKILDPSSTSSSGGVVLRSNGTTGYCAANIEGSGVFRFWRFDGATRTLIDDWDYTETWTNGVAHLVKLTVSGSTFHLYIDWGDDLGFAEGGDDEGTQVDSTYSTGQYIGLMWYNNGELPELDDFEGDAL